MRYRERESQFDNEEDAVLDQNIVGDEEEQRRIELEQNLQNLSIQLSFSSPSQEDEDEWEPNAKDTSNHFYQPSESSLELEFPRHYAPPADSSVNRRDNSARREPSRRDQARVSYRSNDEDNGTLYGGHTMSTMAHHASAVTLSAGLGGRGRRANTGESSLSGAEYDPDRPLDNVINGMVNDFSILNMNATRTPKYKTRPSTTSTQAALDPSSTGSTATGSKFTKLAKSLAKEIEASRRWTMTPEREQITPKKMQSRNRSPLRDVLNDLEVADSPLYASRKTRDRTKAAGKKPQAEVFDIPKHNDKSHSRNIMLPDITGLTSAIESPIRKDLKWRTYSGSDDSSKTEAQLYETLTALQTRLNQLDSQNLVSRRRVRELEMELDTCKAEVKRERTRVLEREEIIVAQQRDFQKRKDSSAKAAKMDQNRINDVEGRYREVVEEKRALEALISTLREHLSRLTEELSIQQDQLDELRRLRNCDVRDLRRKISEVNHLKAEIERLGAEVEILRGIVEEGLKERRRVKETIEASQAIEDTTTDNPVEDDAAKADQVSKMSVQRNEVNRDSDTAWSIHLKGAKWKPRTDRLSRITPDQLPHTGAMRSGRFLDDQEVERVSLDIDERRSEKSEESHQVESPHPRASDALAPEIRQASHRRKSGDSGATKPCQKIERVNFPKASTKTSKLRTSVANEKATTETPFPQIRGSRLERLFFSAPEHNQRTCRVCLRPRKAGPADDEPEFPSWLPRKRARFGKAEENDKEKESGGKADKIVDNVARSPTKMSFLEEDRLPPQTVLIRVLHELEDDFTHYKGIYTELAEQYKIIDAASNVVKRNVLAEHLKEVINTLEQKGDQIASLYDLLAFKDKPVSESIVPETRRTSRSPRSPRQGLNKKNATRRYAMHC